jgi:ethanolamine utilization cobalamin adenosyltransferase
VVNVSKVITLNDIAGMGDKKQLVLSKDMIITPSARDWAYEHGIRIVMGDDLSLEGTEEEQGKTRLLNTTIDCIVKQMKACNMPVNKDEMTAIVKTCLERMNCIVE